MALVNITIRSLVATIVLTTSLMAHAQLRVVNYNTLDKPIDSLEGTLFSTIFTAIGNKSINGIAKRVDLLALQEQRGLSGTSTAQEMANLLNTEYGVSSYEASLYAFGTDRVGIVYDSSTVELINTTNVFAGGPRPTFRGQFRPVGYTDSSADLYLYSSHFKAGSSGSDISTRTTEGLRVSNDAAALGTNANFIFSGDFNFGSSSEDGYENLEVTANDPIDLSSWPNSSIAEHMTQSTRTSNLSDGGASGGMDDRFDLQLVSNNLLDGEGLSYLGPTSTGLGSLEHSYQAFGNDGVSYNTRINNTILGRSQPASVLNALYSFSDHLPVVADYQLPAVMDAAIATTIPATIALDEEFLLDVFVENVANVVASLGADELDYTINFTGDLLGSSVADMDLALGGGNMHQLQLDTSSVGLKSGTITIASDSQSAENNLVILDIDFEVIAPIDDPDLNEDGMIDGEDFLLIQWDDPSLISAWEAEYGTTGGGAAAGVVPEPSALSLLGAGLIGLGLRRKIC
ncbi:PEP-CTERM sorting domain-containing protein [Adhaeretor mobilis]|uniref:PEP-CTERM motif protein n=1 Tax=Adhaeretor mobilis TaxID=1930276 RepID=A0A517N1G3_9BACT|nr:PEP-CTERM sorting domain-containing protein [Adhaeretor mobilis]QDT00848.1 PEP-CTERM motif protein [Adhaeretor mobilis]